MLSAAASAHFSKVARRARIDLKLSSELVVENMKFHKVEFPQVASLVLNVPEKAGPVYKGMRHFVRARMPSIKYYNSEVAITRSGESKDPSIDIVFKNGDKVSVPTGSKDSADIWDEVLVAGKGVNHVPARPSGFELAAQLKQQQAAAEAAMAATTVVAAQ